MLQGHPQDHILAHSRNTSVYSDMITPSTRPQASGQGLSVSKTSKVIADKPQFSAYQQQFSPKKTSTTPAPPISAWRRDQQHASTTSAAMTNYSGPGNLTADLQAQVSRLQDELLHLQLIYDSSHSQHNKYLENTMRKLKARFEALSGDHRTLTAQEHAYRKETNCIALEQWLSEGELSGSGKVQTLAICIQEVASLTALDGNLSDAMEQFQTWFERTIVTSNSRSSATAPLEYYDILISPLGQEWHDVVAVLHRKLDHCGQVLEDLGPAIEGSGLAMVLDTHKRFVHNLRQELEYSSAIEKIILEREQVWTDEFIASIMHEQDPIAAENQRRDLKPGAWNVDMT